MRILICLLLVFAGCESGKIEQVDRKPDINYVIVEIEGKKWIATPSYAGHWSLAGPIE